MEPLQPATPEDGMPKLPASKSFDLLSQPTKIDFPAGLLNPPQANTSLHGAREAVASTVTAPVAKATTYSVDAPSETVEGRIQGLLDSNSNYMNRARSRGQMAAGRRGLLNSTMAGTSGEAAAIDAAMPIAATDAARYGRVSDINNATTNQFAQFNAGNELAASTTNAQLGTNVSLANMGEAGQNTRFDKSLVQETQRLATQHGYDLETAKNLASSNKLTQDADIAFRTAMQTMDIASRTAMQTSAQDSAKELANIQADYQTLIRTDASASQAINTAAQARLELAKNATNMPPEALKAAMNMINNQLKAALNLHGSINGVDLTGLLDTFGGDATVVQTPAATATSSAAPSAPAATPITTKTGVSFSSDDVKNYMTQGNFPQTGKGFMQAMQKWNTSNPSKSLSLDDLGAAYGMSPAQTAAWMKANPG
jgi:hypothetical protein